MRVNQYVTLVAGLTAAMLLPMACTDRQPSPTIATIEEGFATPPDSIRVAAYWYWLNDNLSPEGAVKDLQAMKRAGITRAQIGMIGIDGLPMGEATYDSDLWWATLRQALITAGELDIEIGIFNCPGWSQSGGPWVKPEQSMRHIVAADTFVVGPSSGPLVLPTVEGACQDVAVIAYPAFASEPFAQTWVLDKQAGKPLTATLRPDSVATLRSLVVRVATPFNTHARLLAKRGDSTAVVASLAVDRYNPERNVGFEPYPPVVVALPEVADADELTFEMDAPGAGTLSVTLSERPMVDRVVEKQLAKMCQVPLPMWDFYMWPAQPEYTTADWTVDPGEVVVLTDRLAGDGTLAWEVPDGRWVVERIAMATTGVTNSPATKEATGLEVDKMNREHLQAHFDAYVGEILRRIPPEERRTLRVVVEDSYETGGQNWTDGLAEKFAECYGYSPLPYLPVLQGIPVGDNDVADRFLWDLRRLVADMVAYEYVGGLRSIANAHGLTTWLENYGHWGFPGEFLLYGGQSDEIAGEYWSEGTLGDIENRAASSCGHIYGKSKVWAESCTAAGKPYARYPNVMKQRVDRFFTEGINASLLHLVIHQMDTPEEPGIAAWFGNEFNRKNIWYDHLDLFTAYLRRCNYVLQQGRYVADAAYFIGEDAPKMTGTCEPALPAGYSFDYINADVLRNHARVSGGRLVLDSGMEYRLLVLPPQTTMRPEMLDCIRQLAHDGLNVVGPAPERSPSLAGYPDADARVKAIAAEMWAPGSSCTAVGRGKVWADGTPLADIFADMGLRPDFEVAPDEPSPLFIHRTLPDAEVYFVANPTGEPMAVCPTFRVADGTMKPQLWDAARGTVRTLPEYNVLPDGGIAVGLQFEPLESAFIVFRRDGAAAAEGSVNYPAASVVADLTHAKWTIGFEAARRGPSAPIEADSLFDWAHWPDPAIADYSGKAVYTTTFRLDALPGGPVWVDLGNVMVTAKVRINGTEAGGAWTAPYMVELTPHLAVGDNTLEVEVASTWHNRLVADAALAPERRLTWLNSPLVKPGEPRQSAGLLGPCRLLAYPSIMVH